MVLAATRASAAVSRCKWPLLVSVPTCRWGGRSLLGLFRSYSACSCCQGRRPPLSPLRSSPASLLSHQFPVKLHLIPLRLFVRLRTPSSPAIVLLAVCSSDRHGFPRCRRCCCVRLGITGAGLLLPLLFYSCSLRLFEGLAALARRLVCSISSCQEEAIPLHSRYHKGGFSHVENVVKQLIFLEANTVAQTTLALPSMQMLRTVSALSGVMAQLKQSSCSLRELEGVLLPSHSSPCSKNYIH